MWPSDKEALDFQSFKVLFSNLPCANTSREAECLGAYFVNNCICEVVCSAKIVPQKTNLYEMFAHCLSQGHRFKKKHLGAQNLFYL